MHERFQRRRKPILNRVEQLLRRQLDAPTTPGAPQRGYVGLVADDRQDQGRGVRILSVTPNGPAAAGGLQAGDLIVAVGNQPVRMMDDMARALANQYEGAKLSFAIERRGASEQHEVTLGRRAPARPVENVPPPPAIANDGAPGSSGPRLGVRTLKVSEEAREQNHLSDTAGALVIAVSVGSAADRGGIPLGAVITAVDGQKVDSPDTLAAAIRRAGDGEVELTYFSGGQETKTRAQLSTDTPAGEQPKLELRGRPVAEPDELPPPPDPILSELEKHSSLIETLEVRIRELEARLEALEAKLKIESTADENPGEGKLDENRVEERKVDLAKPEEEK